MHPYLAEKLAEQRRDDLIASAQRRSLAAAVAPPSALRLRLGHRFIALGESLVCSAQHPVSHSRT